MADDVQTTGMVGGAADLRRIRAALSAWDTRLRLQQSLAWLPRGLAAGLALAVLVAAAARIWPIMMAANLIRLAVLLALGGALAVLLAVWLWRRSPLSLARRFDRQFGLKERLSTALELSEGALPVESGALAAAQRADAAAALDRVDARQRLPLRTGWQDWALVGAAALLFASAIIFPNPQDDVLAEQAEVAEVIAEQLEELEALREQAIEDPALSEDLRTELVEQLDEAIETLSQRDLTREEAFAALDEAERDLRELSQETAQERREALQGAGEQLRQAGAEAAARQLEQGDFEAAGESLAEMLDDLSAEQAESMAEQLEELADQLESADAELADALRAAAEALSNGDMDAAREAMERAGEQLAEAGEPGESTLGQYAERMQQSQAEVAEAGQPGDGSQPGQGQMGQAQQDGQPGSQPGGQGQGSQGQGDGPGGASDGPEAGQLTGDTPRGGGAPDGGEDEAQIYAPQRIGGEGGEQMNIPGDPDSVPVQEGEFAENPTGESTVPYSQVYGDYSESVNEALEGGHIPLGMRGLIQKYFSRLDPAE